MKKIMFNDRFGLTDAVIEKRKTITRRIINPQPDRARHWNPIYVKDEPMYYRDERGMCQLISEDGNVIYPPYKVYEVVAISQSYKDIGYNGEHSWRYYVMDDNGNLNNERSVGYYNKMFVKAELMPHQIKITDIRAERLQDITDEDCILEGVTKGIVNPGEKDFYFFDDNKADERLCFPSARDAFANLINRVSDKDTWESDPFVWRIEFELMAIS